MPKIFKLNSTLFRTKAVEILKDTSYRKNLLIQFTKIHHQLKQNTSYRLNKIILKFIK